MPPQDHPAHQDNAPRLEPIYVLFEGPWLIFESAPGLPTLTAVTVGAQMDDEQHNFVHSCAVLTWYHNEQVSSTALPAGDHWFIRGCNYQTRKLSRVIADAYDDQNIAWISKKSCSSHAYPGDRSVILPVPSSMHFAGILEYASVTGGGLLASDPKPVSPHVVTILKYMPEIGGKVAPSLTLHQGDCSRHLCLEAGTHLIFRLRHTDMMMDQPDSKDHVTQAFSHLKAHLSNGELLQFDFNGKSTFKLGDAQGLGFEELGLNPDDYDPDGSRGNQTVFNGTYANCCGGGGFSGGTSNNPPPLQERDNQGHGDNLIDEKE
jgi:hypothetical protein